MGVDIIYTEQTGEDKQVTRLKALAAFMDIVAKFQESKKLDIASPSSSEIIRYVIANESKYENIFLIYYNSEAEDEEDTIWDSIPLNILCFFVYVLRNFKVDLKSEDGNVEEEVKQIIDYSENIDDIVKKCDCKNIFPSKLPECVRLFVSDLALMLFSFSESGSTDLLVRFSYIFDDRDIDMTDVIYNNKITKLLTLAKNRFSLDDFTIHEFFQVTNAFGKTMPSLFGLLYNGYTPPGLVYNHNDIQSAKQNILNYLKTHLVEEVTDDNVTEILKRYNTEYCNVVRDDIFTQISFKEFPFSDIYKIINLDSGHCYTYDYLAKILIMNNGVLNIDTQRYDKASLGIRMGVYYFKHQDIFREFLLEDIKKLEIADNSIKNTINNSTTSYTVEQLSSFFTYMLKSHKDTITLSGVKESISTSLGTYIDLVGLLGYTCYSDDIANMDQNESAQYFQISGYCIEKFKEFDTQGFAINNINPRFVVAEISCIHGIGVKLLQWFVEAREIMQRIMYDIAEQKVVKDKDRDLLEKLGIDASTDPIEIRDILKKSFILPPFVLLAPPIVYEHTGYQYLVVVRDEKLYNRNPLVSRYVITLLGKGKTAVKVSTIDCLTQFAAPTVLRTTLDFMVRQGNYDIVSIDPNSNLCNFCTYHIKWSNPMYIIDMIRSSYTFQRHKAIRFHLFAEYSKNIINILTPSDPGSSSVSSASSSSYQKLKDLSLIKVFDIMSLKHKRLPLKLFTVLDLGNGNHGHMYGNAKVNPGFNTESVHVDLLENIINLQYQPSDKEPRVVLATTGQDITRQYEYCKILATMVYPKVHVADVVLFPAGDQNNGYYLHNKKMFPLFENYMLNVYGQSSILLSRIFKNLIFKLGDKIFTKASFGNLGSILQGIENKELRPYINAIIAELASINLVNATVVLKKLLELYSGINPADAVEFFQLQGALKDFIEEILARVRLLMYCAYSYYGLIMPNNDTSYTNLWRLTPITDEEIYTKVWLKKIEQYTYVQEIGGNDVNIDPLSLEDLTYIHERYQRTIHEIMNIVCYLQISPTTMQYHFTEINKEVHMLKYLDKMINDKTDEILTADNNTDPETKRNTRIIAKLHVSIDVIGNTFHPYKDAEVEVMKLRANDLHGSFRERFDYLAKIDIMNRHCERMAQFKYFEDILCNVYDNILSTYSITIDELAGDDGTYRLIYSASSANDINLYYDLHVVPYIFGHDNTAKVMMDLQDFFIKCLNCKEVIDDINKLNVEKEVVHRTVKEYFIIVNDGTKDKCEKHKVLKTLVELKTYLPITQPESRSTNITHLADALTLLTSSIEKLKIDKNSQGKEQYLPYLLKIFEYYNNWILSINAKYVEVFETETKRLIKMIQVSQSMVDQKITELPSGSGSGSGSGGSQKKLKKKKKQNMS